MQKEFLKVLFDEGEQTCFTSTPFGTELSLNPDSNDVFFSINPMVGSRKDANVTKFRNILIELDDRPLAEQLDYVMTKVPVSTVVYSGGKSYHFIISLVTPLQTREEYDELVRRVYALLPATDRTCKNPSRLSRLPFAVRPETGVEQTLKGLGTRVLNAQLEALLPELRLETPKQVPDASYIDVNIKRACLFPVETMQSLSFESRNTFFFWLGQRMHDINMPIQQRKEFVEIAYKNLENKNKFSLREAKNAARLK